MFEKESKEYANKWLEHVKDLELQHKSDEKPEYIRILEAHQKGVEFGYNKANEWHDVKDGKYPKENQLVMVYRVNPLGANIAITNWYDSYKDTKVIAWKEIVLPELKESE